MPEIELLRVYPQNLVYLSCVTFWFSSISMDRKSKATFKLIHN